MLRFPTFLAALVLAGSAFANGTPNSFVTPQTAFRGGVLLGPSPNTTVNQFYTVYTGGSNGSKCNALVASNNDAASHNTIWRTYNGATILFGGGGASVAAGAGYVTAPTQPLMNAAITPGLPLDQNGNQYIILGPGDLLAAAYQGAVSTGGVFVFALCSDF